MNKFNESAFCRTGSAMDLLRPRIRGEIVEEIVVEIFNDISVGIIPITTSFVIQFILRSREY